MFVLDVIADDYENLEQIRKEVNSFGARSGLTIGSDEILEGLISLIEDGLAKAYRLSQTEPVEAIEGQPPPAAMEDYYFWVTKKGRELQTSEYEDWPFEETGALRKGWTPPRD